MLLLEQNSYNEKKYLSNHIERPIGLKCDLVNNNNIYKMIINKNFYDELIITDKININYKKLTGKTLDSFKPCKFICDNESLIYDSLLYSQLSTPNLRTISEKIHKLFTEELDDFFENKINSNYHSEIIKETLLKADKMIMLFDRTNKNILLLNGLINILIVDKCVILFNDLFLSIVYNNIILSSCENKSIGFKFNKSNVVGMIKNNNKKGLINIKEQPDKTINMYIKHTDPQSRLECCESNLIIYPNNDQIEFCKKLGVNTLHKYKSKTNTSNIISVYSKEGDNNLRYRGKYKSSSKDGKTIKEILEINDKVVYEKDEEEVLIDSISNLTLKDDDLIIGWKITKNINGEYRIIKLGIPVDAEKLKPVHEEFFVTREKERSNKAIVMDIQLPVKEEISVVPKEMVAYSFVYSDTNKFEYKVGCEVIPDTFCSDPAQSCASGIHYYRDRNSIFEIYL